MPARLLVTGGAGFIGSHLTRTLVARGDAVSVIDDLSTGVREAVPPSAKLVVADIRHADLGAALRQMRPDLVVHLAAQANVRRSVVDPLADAETNVLGSLKLFKACGDAGVRRLVFASSGGAIYGEQSTIPTPEDEQARPASPYGAAKLSVERYLDAFGATSGLESIALRFGNVYGPGQRPEGEAGVIAIFAERMLAGHPVTVFGDGSQTRDYVFVEDVVEGIVRAVDRLLAGRPSRPINIGTGVETSVTQIVDALEQALELRADRRHEAAIAGELARNCLDVGRAKAELGWTPRVTLADGIAPTAAWFRERSQRSGR